MTILVNGETQPMASDVAALLQRMSLADAIVATALNGRFVGVSARSATPLQPGDRVEILAPMQGG